MQALGVRHRQHPWIQGVQFHPESIIPDNGMRIVAKNGMLWVMFLACMATSVFFSFDSRFNVIFPKDQRERAAEIRTKNQVAGVVATRGNAQVSVAFVAPTDDGGSAITGYTATCGPPPSTRHSSF